MQHQLRAHTPNDAKALKQTVATFPKSHYDLAETLQQLGIGEAIVTVMDPDGAPTPVAWTRMRAPQSLMAPTPEEVLRPGIAASALMAKYGQAIDRDSAREMLARKLEAGARRRRRQAAAAEAGQAAGRPADQQAARERPAVHRRPDAAGEVEWRRWSATPRCRQMARTATREIFRSIFGTARRR